MLSNACYVSQRAYMREANRSLYGIQVLVSLPFRNALTYIWQNAR